MKPEITTIESLLLRVVRLLCPPLEDLDEEELPQSVADVLGLLYGAPIALVGVIWLAVVTDLSVIRDQWPLLLLLLGALILLRQWPFSVFVKIGPKATADWHESLEIIVSWSAALLFGPTALWVTFLATLTGLAERRQQPPSALLRWNRARIFVLEIAEVTAGLVALALYERCGGLYPPPDFTLKNVAPVAYATLTRFALYRLCWLPMFAYWIRVLRQAHAGYSLKRYIVIVMALPALVDPFAILACAVYALAGLGTYLFFVAGLIPVSLLGNRLSKTALRSRQHAHELGKLEQLGRAILRTPVDPPRLGQVLAEHVPTLFPKLGVEVRLFSDQVIYRSPGSHVVLPEFAWEWLRTLDTTRHFMPGETPPWTEEPLVRDAVVLAPIFEPDRTEPVGGIAMARRIHSRWEVEETVNSLPAIQTMSGQIGSALHGAQLYRLEQELALAGQIQASFLPNELPDIPGWQVVAALEPARQTSGDFYDVIPLPNGRYGIVVADVADKGMGAALYMALARTLLRTYALEYHTQPDLAMRVTNKRILMDTDVTMFVTVFYGILDPLAGTLTYCNAGHNPPCIFRAAGGQVQELSRTGMALGAIPGVSWEQRAVELLRSDMLVLYTDGVTDAQDAGGALFGRERLLEIARTKVGQPAHEVLDCILQAVQKFSGEASQYDDITLLIALRDARD